MANQLQMTAGEARQAAERAYQHIHDKVLKVVQAQTDEAKRIASLPWWRRCWEISPYDCHHWLYWEWRFWTRQEVTVATILDGLRNCPDAAIVNLDFDDVKVLNNWKEAADRREE